MPESRRPSSHKIPRNDCLTHKTNAETVSHEQPASPTRQDAKDVSVTRTDCCWKTNRRPQSTMGAVRLRAAISAALVLYVSTNAVHATSPGSGLHSDSASRQRRLSETQERQNSEEATQLRSRELQWPSVPSLYPGNPYLYPPPQYAAGDDDSYYGKGATYPGKGKGTYPVEPPVGKGIIAPPTMLPPPGKGGGAWPGSKSKKGSKGGYVPPPGKGKGWVPPPLYDDYMGGKGSVVVPPPSDDMIGKGKGGYYPGKGKGGFYPVPLPTYGKGKGSHPVGKGKGSVVPPPPSKGSKGKGKGGYFPPGDDYYAVHGCRFPWDGVSPIPGDMWVGKLANMSRAVSIAVRSFIFVLRHGLSYLPCPADQNHCLHFLPPAAPLPPIPPTVPPVESPRPQPTRTPPTKRPASNPTSPMSKPTRQPASSFLPTAIPTSQTVDTPTTTPLNTVQPSATIGTPAPSVEGSTVAPAPLVPTTTAPTTTTSAPSLTSSTLAPSVTGSILPPTTSAPSTTTPAPSIASSTLSPSVLSSTVVPSPSVPTTPVPTPLTSGSLTPSLAPSGTTVEPSVSSSTTTPSVASVAPTPAASGTLAPSSAATTSSPVAGAEVQTSFDVTYTLDPVGVPSAENFDAAAQATLAYLQSYLEEFYNLSPFSILVGFSGSPTGNNGAGDPAEISFDVSAVFGDNSVQIPSAADLDVLIETALQPPAVNALLDQLEALGAGNPFSGTVNAVYSAGGTARKSSTSPSSISAESAPIEKSKVAAQVTGSLAAVAAVLASIAAIAVMRRRRREGPSEAQAEKNEIAVDDEDNCSVGTDAAVSEVDTASLFEEATQDLD
jgi:hypothetical protein